MEKGKDISRRDFLKSFSAASFALGFAPQIDFVSKISSVEPSGKENLINYLQNPYTMILKKVSDPKTEVFALGEMHSQDDMERFAINVVDLLGRYKLIDYLALEIDVAFKEDMDAFNKGLGMSERLTDYLEPRHKKGYFTMMEKAQEHKIPIVCTTSLPLEKTTGTDDFISWEIINYRKSLGKPSKGLFFAGNVHVAKLEGDPLVDQLGDSYVSCMIHNGKYESYNKAYQAYAALNLPYPVAVDSVAKSPLADFLFGNNEDKWSAYGKIVDSLIFLPPEV
jgi:hypothetical protein